VVIDSVEPQRHVRAVDHPADVTVAHWCTAAVRNDDPVQLGWFEELNVSADLVSLLRPLQTADRQTVLLPMAFATSSNPIPRTANARD